MLEEDFDLIAFLRDVLELVQRNRTLGLEADVQDDRLLRDPQHLRLDDLALGDGREGVLMHRQHLGVIGVAVILVEQVLPNANVPPMWSMAGGLAWRATCEKYPFPWTAPERHGLMVDPSGGSAEADNLPAFRPYGYPHGPASSGSRREP